MPRGAKPGERRGSRQLTVEHYVRSTQVAARQKDKEGPKLGKEVIEHFMKLAMRNAIACKPTEDDLTPSQDTAVQGLKDWKLNQFKGWASLALQLLLWEMSESMGNHDSEVVDASSVD
jgi:hypothetical protein